MLVIATKATTSTPIASANRPLGRATAARQLRIQTRSAEQPSAAAAAIIDVREPVISRKKARTVTPPSAQSRAFPRDCPATQQRTIRARDKLAPSRLG